jgi:hydroxyethylthiazole kinase-like uncharacterized protein yjeF
MKEIVTCIEMMEIERKAAERGLSYYQMMENAGTAAADFIATKETVSDCKVLVFCGSGNNGGDGFVVARKLYEKGGKVCIILVHGEAKTPDAITNLDICRKLGIEVINNPIGSDVKYRNRITAYDIIVDAIYGTGFHGYLKEEIKEFTDWINNSGAKIFSLDIPSGINGDTGKRDHSFVKADYTVVFHRLKPAHKINERDACCGELVLVDIGI